MIPIVFGIDQSYLLQAFVVMHSILRNSEEQFHFIVLTKDDIEAPAEELKRILAGDYSNFIFEIRRIGAEAFEDVKIHNQHLSQSSYFRLLISELVLEYDKCLYLDSDILVNGDLRELYDTDVEGCYLAGVRDCHLSRKAVDFLVTKHQLKMGFSSAEDYINAGVLVMNLKRLRGDKMAVQFLEQTKKENPYEDQDVMNVCCYGQIKTLPLKYNVFHHYTGRTVRYLFGGSYAKEEFLYDWDRPYIMHFAEKYKPWINKKYKGADRWWETAGIFKSCACYQETLNHCREAWEDIRDMADIFETCRKGRHVILWGFTEQGRDVCNVFLKKGIRAAAFCDSDSRKQGKSYRRIPVLAPELAAGKEKNAVWIITCKNAYREVYKQIVGLGISEENVFHFTYNSRNWKEHLVLSPEYYKEEIDVIAMCENDNTQTGEKQYRKAFYEVIKKADMKDGFYRYLYSKYRFDLWLDC